MSGFRWLYRGVSQAELEQLLRTGRFAYGKGAEGKYFWEHLEDAIAWSKNFPTTVIGNARFADLSQMNESLLAVEPAG
jgi:hypothetical protein